MRKQIGFLCVCLVAAVSAQAMQPPPDKSDFVSYSVKPVAAPEIDPSAAISGLTLLFGAGAIIRGRKYSNK